MHAEAFKRSERVYPVEDQNIIEDTETGGVSMTYRPSELKTWVPAKPVPVLYGLSGEQGKGVNIPAEHEAIMKEKFKLNQFNILASDKISLNRSLLDVRHDKFVFYL